MADRERINFGYIHTAFLEAFTHQLADSITYSLFIKAASNAKQFSYAHEALKEARTSGNDSAEVYTNYIIAAGKAGKFDKAHSAFIQAKRRNKLDTPLLTSFILVARDFEEFDLAHEAFHSAKRRRLLDSQLCMVAMKSAARAGCYSRVKEIFQIAENHSLVKSSLCNIFVDVLFERKRDKEAKELCLGYRDILLEQKQETDGLYHDFHGCSAHVTRILLEDLLHNSEPSKPLRIIIGQGGHSRTPDGRSVIVDTVRNVLTKRNIASHYTRDSRGINYGSIVIAPRASRQHEQAQSKLRYRPG